MKQVLTGIALIGASIAVGRKQSGLSGLAKLVRDEKYNNFESPYPGSYFEFDNADITSTVSCIDRNLAKHWPDLETRLIGESEDSPDGVEIAPKNTEQDFQKEDWDKWNVLHGALVNLASRCSPRK
jgi:hypothetical protein